MRVGLIVGFAGVIRSFLFLDFFFNFFHKDWTFIYRDRNEDLNCYEFKNRDNRDSHNLIICLIFRRG